jgi:hypothetical protein
VPVLTAVRGAFPLNGTYFQVGNSFSYCGCTRSGWVGWSVRKGDNVPT